MPILKSGEARIHYALEGQSGSPVLAFSIRLAPLFHVGSTSARVSQEAQRLAL